MCAIVVKWCLRLVTCLSGYGIRRPRTMMVLALKALEKTQSSVLWPYHLMAVFWRWKSTGSTITPPISTTGKVENSPTSTLDVSIHLHFHRTVKSSRPRVCARIRKMALINWLYMQWKRFLATPRAPGLPLAFFDEPPSRSGSVEGRAPAARRKGTGLSSISVANTAEQASPRATGRKQRLSLSTIWSRPRSRQARSIAREAQLPAAPGTGSQKRRNPRLSRMWKRIRHPRSHKNTQKRSGKSPSGAGGQERGHDQDGHNENNAEYSHNHDNESEIIYTSQDTESVRAHGCWNVFWIWVCYKAL
ncbi:hypothetical protein M405DRAFT_482058 [Rhizopogon salebrosus TDB-379]|nr:hypothetical protein M405DRAFT_482058 [Rhizopogon salebrosus TDB-379]